MKDWGFSFEGLFTYFWTVLYVQVTQTLMGAFFKQVHFPTLRWQTGLVMVTSQWDCWSNELLMRFSNHLVRNFILWGLMILPICLWNVICWFYKLSRQSTKFKQFFLPTLTVPKLSWSTEHELEIICYYSGFIYLPCINSFTKMYYVCNVWWQKNKSVRYIGYLYMWFGQ